MTEDVPIDKQQQTDSPAVAPPRNTTLANKIFNGLNYYGFGFLANSAISLWITYNVMPTQWAQGRIDNLRTVIKPLVGGWDGFKQLIGRSKNMNQSMRALHIHESARSTAEAICMCIGGFFVLVPMKWMEDHKKSIVDKIDRWCNPEYYRHCEKNAVTPEPLPHEEKDLKQSWGKLLGARMVGFASVIGVDGVLQIFNNRRQGRGRPNLDTLQWSAGGKIYDTLPTSLSEKFINFFSARKTTDLSNIQPQVRDTLEKTVGSNHKRMMFAEQTRFCMKEMTLTLIMASIIFGLTKTGVVSWALEKLGIKKPAEQKQTIDDMLPDLPFVPITEGRVELRSTHADKTQKAKKTAASESYTQKLASEPATAYAAI